MLQHAMYLIMTASHWLILPASPGKLKGKRATSPNRTFHCVAHHRPDRVNSNFHATFPAVAASYPLKIRTCL